MEMGLRFLLDHNSIQSSEFSVASARSQVWDRRCFVSKGRPAGVLVGHMEGITFIDSRGDGRYFITNGKDQTTKLWDIRRMTSTVNWCSLSPFSLSGSRPWSTRFPLKHGMQTANYGIALPPCSSRPRTFDWDYRWMEYPERAKLVRHPSDQSLATYRGHSVLRTLIRCYFSPAHR